MSKLRQETGLIAEQARVFCVTDPEPEAGHHMQVGVLVTSFNGTIVNHESDFSEDLRFFSETCLPSPLFCSSQQILANYLAGSFYSPRASGEP